MKVVIKSLLTGLCFIAVISARHHAVSQSFFSTAGFQLPTPLDYQHFWSQSGVATKKPSLPEKQKVVSITGFCARSTDTAGLNRYFGPFDKSEYRVKEYLSSADIDTGGQDILSYNFNIVTTDGDFQSIIKFKPRWLTGGVNLKLFWQRCEKYWLELEAPIAYTKTTMSLHEQVLDSGSGSINNLGGGNFDIDGVLQASTMTAAFKQPQMMYGRIDGARSSTRLAHVKATIGWNTKRTQNGYIQPFTGLLIPGGNKPKGYYLFEPIVGNNRHVELFMGMQFGKNWKDFHGKHLFMSGSLQMNYKIPNHQVRSFDPGGKPWGRYLALADNPADLAAGTYKWGIKQFTKTVKVSPHVTHTGQLFLHLLQKRFNTHFGYRLQVASPETIALRSDWQEPAITSLVNGARVVVGRGINNLLDDTKVTTYLPVKEYELNLDSAAHPYHVTHTFMASVDWQFKAKQRLFTGDAGVAYSTARTNAALHHWTAWLSIVTPL